ncbi:hypothetical protein EYF80_051541 [Liparis tanakae]|uniref:Uncharacterized protein n=1 Tax=Liparis tanakae TaxID=230148 RepID=A0A4Z2FC01_9TELE|nr:hypothetical protein EYF80_051541 [Liparis tanakae]
MRYTAPGGSPTGRRTPASVGAPCLPAVRWAAALFSCKVFIRRGRRWPVAGRLIASWPLSPLGWRSGGATGRRGDGPLELPARPTAQRLALHNQNQNRKLPPAAGIGPPPGRGRGLAEDVRLLGI